jgi:hypothetical protein
LNSTGWTVSVSGSAEDLDRAVDAASRVFKEWRHVWSPDPGVKKLAVVLTVDDRSVVSAAGSAIGICADCGRRSRSRHGWSRRNLQDLPVQGQSVTVKLLVSRWRCAHGECARRTFTDRLPTIAAPYARRTRLVVEIVGLLGHSAGGHPGGRLMERLGMWQLKRDAAAAQRSSETPSRNDI